MFGHLEPLSGGESIPLPKRRLRIGRREGCDIVLDFSDISSHHALIEIEEGYWFIKDMHSRNGVRVAGKKLLQELKKRLDPNEIFALAKHEFIIRYDPGSLGAYGTPPQDEQLDNLFARFMEGRGKAGGMKGIRPRNDPRDYPPPGGAARPPGEDD